MTDVVMCVAEDVAFHQAADVTSTE